MDELELPAGEERFTLYEADNLVVIKNRNLMSQDDMAARQYTYYEEQLYKILEIKDWEAVRIIIACVCAHFVEGTPLWVRLIGASRSGRTELLRTIISYGADKDPEKSDVAEMESLSPATIRGGFQGGGMVLNRIKGKLVITKDISALLTTRPEIRKEIMGLARSIKDGSLTSDFNTEEGYIHQEGEFDWIIATTPVFEGERTMEDLLGARYVDLLWTSGERLKITSRALDNSPKLKEMRIDQNKV